MAERLGVLQRLHRVERFRPTARWSRSACSGSPPRRGSGTRWRSRPCTACRRSPRSSNARPGRRSSWCRRRGSARLRRRPAPRSASAPNSAAENAPLSITASMRVGDRARLLVDFLLHEVAVRAQLQRGQRHVGDVHLARRPRRCRRRTRARRSRVTSAVSPSSRKITRRVACRIAETSLATKFSPSPRPTSSGEPMRAATRRSGSRWLTTAMA